MLHIVGAIGLSGGLAAYMIVIYSQSDVHSVESYLSFRTSLANISAWLIVPSMAVTLFSGIFSMAVHSPFHNAVWAWIKAATGILIFEETLRSIDAPAKAAIKMLEQIDVTQIQLSELTTLVQNEWLSWWTILGLSLLNIVLGIWRPKYY